VAPDPPAKGLIVPEILEVCAAPVKLIPERFAPFTFAGSEAGLKMKPALLGDTVYVPFDNPMKVKLPDPSATVLEVAAPVRPTVAPLPAATGEMMPEMFQVWAVADAVKLIPVTLATLMVAFDEEGLKVKPVLLGVIVYGPFASPEKLKLPDASAVVVALLVPLSVTVVPLPADEGLTVPERLQVWAVAVKVTPLTFAPLTVTARDKGLKLNPALLGVTVYGPLLSPEKLKLPDGSAVVVALLVPLSVTVAPLPPDAGPMVPERLQVW
jgi:hypothetical protein